MIDGKSNVFEKESEHIPTPEEVYAVFKELTDKEYTEVRKCEDKKGLYLLEVVIPGDSPDEVTEYAYMREGQYAEGQTLATEIHIVYYKNEIAIGGTSVARYIDGKWVIL